MDWGDKQVTDVISKQTPIYVAGHQGMLGSAFMHRLQGAGFQSLHTATHDELELCDQPSVDQFFDRVRPEVVIMAAGRVGGIVENRDSPGDFITENLSMQVNVLRAARRVGVRKFIFFASSCMYPRECEQPMREEMLLTGQPEPTSIAYATAKLAGVQMCLAFNRQDGGERFIPVIPNTMYGPGDNFDLASSHVLPALIRRFHEAKLSGSDHVTLWGSGTPRREFVFVDDVVDAVFQLLQAPSGAVELPVNIGCGKDYAIAELAQIIAQIVGYEGEIRWDTSCPDGAPRKLLDSRRMQALGWSAKTPLDQGLSQTYGWFLDQNEGRV